MKTLSKKILIVGLFLSEKNRRKILRTAADQLAELLTKHNIPVITVSVLVNPVGRFIDTITKIISHSSHYNIGIVPLYGGLKSYVWESISTRTMKLLGKKTVLIVHGGSIPVRMKTESKRYLKSFKRADVIVCPSNYIKSCLKEYNIESVLIENVLNLAEYTFHPKETFKPTIFWMRTLEDIYNPEMAVRVGALLAAKYSDFKMVMAGYDRGSLTMVKELAQEKGIANKIEFPGYITKEQKNKYAAELDIYICTNRIDNAPVSLVEMMAMGLPVVTVNSGGIPFMVTDNYNGLVVNLDDDEAMANAIIAIVENPALGKKLVNNGLAYSKQYDEQPVLQKWKNVFEQLEKN
ncbi:MAG: glycosyltransferase family 4 protein [Segetibacter sp.]|nr:glycosyltransferase family 4 protein [Segetibacter sp.]